MTDVILPNSSKKGSSMNTPITPANPNPLGLDLGEFRLTSEECRRANQGAKLVYGLDFMLFEQCSNSMNTPILSINCEAQTADGITWDLKADTGEIATNCPNSKRSYLKHESMTIEVSLSAIALADRHIIDFLEGRRTAANGNVRSYGFGAVKTYIVALIDRESMTAAIYPSVQYIPSSIQIKRAWNSEPSSKIMFTVSKADMGDGDPFFYETRSIAPAQPIAV